MLWKNLVQLRKRVLIDQNDDWAPSYLMQKSHRTVGVVRKLLDIYEIK